MLKRHLLEAIGIVIFFGFFTIGFITTGDMTKHLQLVFVYTFNFIAGLLALFVLYTFNKRSVMQKAILFFLSLIAIFGLLIQELKWIAEDGYIMLIIGLIWIVVWIDIAKKVKPLGKF